MPRNPIDRMHRQIVAAWIVIGETGGWPAQGFGLEVEDVRPHLQGAES